MEYVKQMELLRRSFLNSDIIHVPRTANLKADSLARSPRNQPSFVAYQCIKDPTHLASSCQQTQKTRSPFPSLLSSDEVFTSRYGSTSTNYHAKTTRSKPRRSKESEFQVNPSKKPTLTSSSSHESVEDSKMKGKDIGIIEFSMANLLNNLREIPELPVQKDQQPLSSRQITKISHYSDINEVYSSDEEMNYAPPNQEIPMKKFSSKIMVFTFDDIPFEKWKDRLDEFHAWMNSEAITSLLQLVIQQFTARLSGALKEWWNSLGEYRQQQVYQTTIPLLLGEIHR
uniref:RNase H type-1 domain-containing protein n=1 Tax=Brassica campestris TaxID=3711 RepID=M4FCP2_BRACM